MVDISLCEQGQLEPTPETQTSSGGADKSSLSSQGCRPDGGGGWCTPDAMSPSGVPGGWAAGFPRGCPVRAGVALFISVSRSQYLGLLLGCMCSVLQAETQNPMPLKDAADNEERPRGRHLHHLTCDIKGIISVALSVLSGIILCYKTVSVVVLMPS